MKTEYTDILIIGGGPVGAALALALRGSGLAVTLIEARLPEAVDDPRAIALSYGSRLLLERLGVWPAPSTKLRTGLAAATPIERIHVSQCGGFGASVLTPQDAGVPVLGHVADYGVLWRALTHALSGSGVTLRTGARVSGIGAAPEEAFAEYTLSGKSAVVRARLLVLAEGGALAEHLEGITYRKADYGEALVARVKTETPHRGTAYERFTPEGPLALLPFEKGPSTLLRTGFALVWSMTAEAAHRLVELDESSFLAELQHRFGGRAGRFVSVSGRSSFPLRTKYATPAIAHRVVLVGNAAQTLHPVAGQGFNLGLRDAWELAEIIRDLPREEIGSDAMLARFRARRRMDSAAGRAFTDSLVRVFSNSVPLLAAARGLGLAALDGLPWAKRFLCRRMIFGVRG